MSRETSTQEADNQKLSIIHLSVTLVVVVATQSLLPNPLGFVFHAELPNFTGAIPTKQYSSFMLIQKLQRSITSGCSSVETAIRMEEGLMVQVTSAGLVHDGTGIETTASSPWSENSYAALLPPVSLAILLPLQGREGFEGLE